MHLRPSRCTGENTRLDLSCGDTGSHVPPRGLPLIRFPPNYKVRTSHPTHPSFLPSCETDSPANKISASGPLAKKKKKKKRSRGRGAKDCGSHTVGKVANFRKMCIPGVVTLPWLPRGSPTLHPHLGNPTAKWIFMSRHRTPHFLNKE